MNSRTIRIFGSCSFPESKPHPNLWMTPEIRTCEVKSKQNKISQTLVPAQGRYLELHRKLNYSGNVVICFALFSPD